MELPKKKKYINSLMSAKAELSMFFLFVLIFKNETKVKFAREFLLSTLLWFLYLFFIGAEKKKNKLIKKERRAERIKEREEILKNGGDGEKPNNIPEEEVVFDSADFF